MKIVLAISVLLLIVLAAQSVDAFSLRELITKRLIYKKTLRPGKDCEVSNLQEWKGQTSCAKNDNSSVTHGTECRFKPNALDQTFIAKCVDGQWIRGGTRSVDSTRVKRFIDWIILGVVLAFGGAVIICAIFCPREPPTTKPRTPPYYKNCPPEDIDKTYYAQKGTTSTKIRWSSPVAKDKDGTIKSNKRRHGPGQGNFDGAKAGRTYTIVYEAVDNDGLTANCEFSFTVKVRFCSSSLEQPNNGQIQCSSGNIYGSICSYSCDPGYELSGDSTSSCQNDGSWTGTATCSRKKCRPPPNISNGRYECGDLYYETVCNLNCDNGFNSEIGYIQCQSDGTWANVYKAICKDTEPPTIHCVEVNTQIFYTDKGALNTTAIWKEPRASDTADASPTVTKVQGPSIGDVLSKGSHVVIYKATDSAGNVSPPCNIVINIKVIECDYPLAAIGDDNMKLENCSDSSYHYGVECHFSCQYYLPLEGTNSTKMVCEKNGTMDNPTGYWKFGNGSTPYCREVNCPQLDPPINGALVYETVNRRPVVIVMCNEKFDIQPMGFNFQGQMFCFDSGNWSPVNKTPDCIAVRRPKRMRLPSELYYYSGDCPDNATLLDIKENFLVILSSVNELYNRICPNKVTCTVDRVSVDCGPVLARTRRDVKLDMQQDGQLEHKHRVNKREESHAVVFRFDIVTTFGDENDTFDDAYDATESLQELQKEEFSRLVQNGTFDMEGLLLRQDSFQPAEYADLACEPGTILYGTTCKPCPKGMHHHELIDQCFDCPVGQYSDVEGATQCESCPEGFSTQQPGSANFTDCRELCQAGTVSPTRLEPCVFCPVGKYQPDIGMKGCIDCPHGKTTSLGGSKDKSQCKDFDLLLTNTNLDIDLDSIRFSESVSIVFWTRPFSSDSSHSARIALVAGRQTGLSISISDDLSVGIGQTYFKVPLNLTVKAWTQVASIWDHENSTIQVYIDGLKRIEEKISWSSPRQPYLSVSANGSDGIYMADLNILDRAFKISEVTSLQSSCTNVIEGTVVSMDAFRNTQTDGLRVIMPATCDAIDECASSPCGKYECINGAGDFTCICKDGMSGKQCEIPPDFCKENNCKNGATCNSLADSYNCSCVAGYTGHFCEVAPVNGNWSSYSDWSDCTAECDGGTRTRARSCDNPPPSIGGLNCSGPSVETESCNTHICRECDEPRKSFGVISNCTSNEATGVIVCEPFCREDTLLPPGMENFGLYSCGPDTDYQWTPFDNFPACIAPEPPSRYGFDVEIPYDTKIPPELSSNVESKVKDNLAKTDCFAVGTCEVIVSLTDEAPGANGSSLTISLGIPIKHTGDLGLQEYVASGTISPGLQEVVEAIVALELSAADMKENASTFFNVEVEGESFSIPEANLSFAGMVDCPEGSVPAEGVCAPCPYGSRSTSKACLYCDVGTYQDETGQGDCKPCPRGLTTQAMGTRNITDCIEDLTVTTTVTTTEVFDRKEQDVPHSDDTGKAVGIAVGFVAGLFLLVVVLLVLYKKRKRIKSYRLKKAKNVESLRLSQPTNGQPAELTDEGNAYEGDEPNDSDKEKQGLMANVSGANEAVDIGPSEETEMRQQPLLLESFKDNV